MTAEQSRSGQAPVTVVVGPSGDGVTEYGQQLACAAGTDWVRWSGNAGDSTTLPAAGVPLHIHVTDRLFGPDPHDAVTALTALADRHPVAVTLHDVPQATEGQPRYRRRSDTYQQIAGLAHTLVVSSKHEHASCAAIGGIVVDEVIPLPIPQFDQVASRPAGRAGSGAHDTVGVFGFIHPGKGADLLVDALIEADISTTVLLLGRPSSGHDDWLAKLAERAQHYGVAVVSTGYLDGADVLPRLQAVTVPVSVFRNVSASGSLNTWIAAGRRPVVLPSDYTAEIQERWPGSVIVSELADLGRTIGELLEQPEDTWRRTAVPQWGWPEVGAAYRAVWGIE